MLAGISSDYYLRLEQGRDKHPSSQVLDALARAMQLDVKATEYLHQLAGLTGRQPLSPPETIAHNLDRLIDQFPMPAIVANRYQDVLEFDEHHHQDQNHGDDRPVDEQQHHRDHRERDESDLDDALVARMVLVC